MKSGVDERADATVSGGRAGHVVKAARSTMLFEQREDFVGIPAGIAEFDYMTSPRGEAFQKRREEFNVNTPPRRQLVEDGPEMTAQKPSAENSRSSGFLGAFSFFMWVRNLLALTAYRNPSGTRDRQAVKAEASGKR